MDKLLVYSKACTTVIEGDVVSAYNKVDHNILLSILRKRIKDKKFLKLIKNLLKSGIMDRSVYQHSLEGTPQGGIVSPLLFNIYMFGLDKFVYNDIISPWLEKERGKTGDEATPAYRKIRYKTDQFYKKLTKQKLEYKINPNPSLKMEIKKTLKEYKASRSIRNATTYSNTKNIARKICYVRYADDWVLALTCNQMEAENIKEKISNYLKIHRRMELDAEKTKISRVADGYKFLGFEIRMLTNNVKQTLTLQKKPKDGGYSRILKRTTSRMLTIEPDSDRILKRLKWNKFCNAKFEPRAKPGWLIYHEYDIVEKYAQIFRGLFNYYLPCERLTRLNRISYILQYSCARTLARKKRMSKSSIFKMYGKNLTIKKIMKKRDEEIVRTTKFLTLTDLRKSHTSIDHSSQYKDPFQIMQYWRTKIKLYLECCICGETESISMHHNNAVRNLVKNTKTIEKTPKSHQAIRSTLNRLQIPVCIKCNNDIANGKYNDPKSPIVYYNEFLAKL